MIIKKTFSIFDIKTKIESILLLILNTISAFLEVISIGSIPVFLYSVLDPDQFISKIPFERVQLFFNEFLKNNDSPEMLSIILFGIVFIFILKNIFVFLVSVYQVYFSRKIKTKYTSKLFNIYINRQYDFFLDSDPASFIKNLDSVHILPGIIMMSLGIVKEVSIIFVLILVVAFTNPSIAILLATIVMISFTFHHFKLGRILRKQGEKSYDYQEKRYSLINEVFGAIADIKISNKESFFSKIFLDFIWKFETTITVTKIINSTIRPFIEILGMLIMVSLVFYFSYLGKSFNEIIPIMSFLVLSLIRIIPSAITITSFLNGFRFEEKQLKYLIDTYEKDKINLINSNIISKKKCYFENSLELKNIDFTYKNHEKRSISNLNLKIEKNDQLAIIGKTGSGKSTMINLICNLLKFSKGQIILNNKTVINPGEGYQLENLHYVRQDIYLLNSTIKKNIAFGKDDKDIDEELVADCLKKVGLNQYIAELNEPIGNRGVKISGGEKQLLSLARALYNKPKFLILDEPTSNLDYKNEKSYFDTIKKLNITTIIVAHRVNTLEYCNQIILLKDGQIIDKGSLENFKKKYDNLNSYLS
jgi:ABC-type bacteriocin/lantibiotic exporter with double-glycine peptidase domain